jgi:CheY-like chemotaxis protein
MASQKHVLVVDDETMMQELVKAMLESEGYLVKVAGDGAGALREINAQSFDLVLLDLRMPGMSGWDLIEQLKSHPSPPPVIAMSGMGVKEPPELRTVREYVYGYLPKPFSQEQMIKTCQRAFDVAREADRERREVRDRRQEPRRNLVISATLLSGDGTPAALGHILNLSTGGAQLDLGAPLQAGMTVTVAFEIPGGHGPFRVSGRIQWRSDARLGLEFVDFSPEDKQRLAELLGNQS